MSKSYMNKLNYDFFWSNKEIKGVLQCVCVCVRVSMSQLSTLKLEELFFDAADSLSCYSEDLDVSFNKRCREGKRLGLQLLA